MRVLVTGGAGFIGSHFAKRLQAAGDDVGPASDIYSLGIVAYECLAGRRPFAGSNPVAVALAHQREQAQRGRGEVAPPAQPSNAAPQVQLTGFALDVSSTGVAAQTSNRLQDYT